MRWLSLGLSQSWGEKGLSRGRRERQNIKWLLQFRGKKIIASLSGAKYSVLKGFLLRNLLQSSGE